MLQLQTAPNNYILQATCFTLNHSSSILVSLLFRMGSRLAACLLVLFWSLYNNYMLQLQTAPTTTSSRLLSLPRYLLLPPVFCCPIMPEPVILFYHCQFMDTCKLLCLLPVVILFYQCFINSSCSCIVSPSLPFCLPASPLFCSAAQLSVSVALSFLL